MNDIITLMTCAEEDGGIGNIHDTWQTVFTSDNGTYRINSFELQETCTHFW